jgi:hypothetical protein
MRKSIITIALVCAVLVALCSCSTAATLTPVKPNIPATTLAAPVKTVGTPIYANLTVNGTVFAGDPIMRDASGKAVVLEGKTTAAGDPIMKTTLKTAAGDPIMMDAAGNYYVFLGNNLVMIAAAGDPIMLYK